MPETEDNLPVGEEIGENTKDNNEIIDKPEDSETEAKNGIETETDVNDSGTGDESKDNDNTEKVCASSFTAN